MPSFRITRCTLTKRRHVLFFLVQLSPTDWHFKLKATSPCLLALLTILTPEFQLDCVVSKCP